MFSEETGIQQDYSFNGDIIGKKCCRYSEGSLYIELFSYEGNLIHKVDSQMLFTMPRTYL